MRSLTTEIGTLSQFLNYLAHNSLKLNSNAVPQGPRAQLFRYNNY